MTHLPSPVSAPRISAALSFAFPPYTALQLSNGIKLIVAEDRSQPLVSLSMVFKRGAASEDVWGAANLMTSLLTKGTANSSLTRTAQDIADAIDFTGGLLSASSGFDSTSASVSVLSEFLPTGLNLLTDVLLHPAFAPDELERLRQQTLVEVQQYLSDAAYLASVAFTQGMFHGTPYGHPVIGTVESVQAMQREDCMRIYKTIIGSGDVFIAAAGDVDAHQLAAVLEQHFAAWPARLPSQTLRPSLTPEAPNTPSGPRVMLIAKPDAAQTAIRVGFPTLHRTDDNFIALQFLNTILGGSFISRLNHNLREQKGYTYGIHSSIDAYQTMSVWACRAHVGSEIVDDAVREILHEIELLRTAPITDDELETTKKYLLGSFALRTETPQQVVSLVSALEMFDLPADYYERYFAEVAAMTKERLFEVQQRCFGAEGLVIAASGDVEHLRSKLRNFGAVSVVNTSGEIVSAV
jgi:zinc protease